MTAAKRIADWIRAFRFKFDCDPKIVLITPVEAELIKHYEFEPYVTFPMAEQQTPFIYGVEAVQSPYADQARQRTLNLATTEFTAGATINELIANISSHKKAAVAELWLQLQTVIATDITTLKVEVECDPWLWLKHLLFLDKLLPARTKTLTIEGRVLYPQLSIQLPHYKHVVKFRLK